MNKVVSWIISIASASLVIYAIVVLVRECREGNPVTFAEYVAEDYEYAMSLKNDSTDVCFYEIQGFLNDLADDSYEDELEVVMYRAIFQTYGSEQAAYLRERNVISGETKDGKVLDTWLQCCDMNPTKLPVSFDKAVKLLFRANKKEGIVIPSSDKVTLREPLGPVKVNPMWIFGGTDSAGLGQSYVAVDAVTGEVKYIN